MWRQKENMESGVDRGPDVECVVNRWTVDYYISVALEAFRNEQYPDFCQIRDILQCHLVRPLEANDVTPKKIRAIQFLSQRITLYRQQRRRHPDTNPVFPVPLLVVSS
uniref:Telomeric repeat-binding factor 2 n=1 Tax=Salmo salar TaxID=8030 RepID=B5XFS8_SALSA|nr:Telomeric repeat-binding factor 2 [Salmo salar]